MPSSLVLFLLLFGCGNFSATPSTPYWLVIPARALVAGLAALAAASVCFTSPDLDQLSCLHRRWLAARCCP
uniref:Putative secreted peptide n=1 Tax=Anopheles braziliensis TaxID=58242 RepID=A0A2M3ZXU3_9DIPT